MMLYVCMYNWYLFIYLFPTLVVIDENTVEDDDDEDEDRSKAAQGKDNATDDGRDEQDSDNHDTLKEELWSWMFRGGKLRRG